MDRENLTKRGPISPRPMIVEARVKNGTHRVLNLFSPPTNCCTPENAGIPTVPNRYAKLGIIMPINMGALKSRTTARMMIIVRGEILGMIFTAFHFIVCFVFVLASSEHNDLPDALDHELGIFYAHQQG